MTVDLVSRTITAGDVVAAFEVDDYTRWRLLEGLDDISLTLRHEPDITAYEQAPPVLEAGHAADRHAARHAVREWAVRAAHAAVSL